MDVILSTPSHSVVLLLRGIRSTFGMHRLPERNVGSGFRRRPELAPATAHARTGHALALTGMQAGLGCATYDSSVQTCSKQQRIILTDKSAAVPENDAIPIIGLSFNTAGFNFSPNLMF